jgi:hypothetical protein
MILYIGKPKYSMKLLLELMNKFNNVPAYKMNIQKSVAVLYTNKIAKKETRKAISFTIATKFKYIGINFTKEVTTNIIDTDERN